MVKHTIKLKNYLNIFEELVASEAITPGMLIELTSAGEVKKHATASGNALPMFATEDALQGKTIDDAYAHEDPVQVWVPQRGDIVNALLADGQHVEIGDFLESNGTGYLQKYVADIITSHSTGVIYGNAIVGQAIEHVDLSGSEGTHPESGLRIKVRII